MPFLSAPTTKANSLCGQYVGSDCISESRTAEENKIIRQKAKRKETINHEPA